MNYQAYVLYFVTGINNLMSKPVWKLNLKLCQTVLENVLLFLWLWITRRSFQLAYNRPQKLITLEYNPFMLGNPAQLQIDITLIGPNKTPNLSFC